MTDITVMIDAGTGSVTVGGLLETGTLALAGSFLGAATEVGCARPLTLLPPPAATAEEMATRTCVRIAGYYHNSLVEGPGRRSSALFQSCPLACDGFIYSVPALR